MTNIYCIRPRGFNVGNEVINLGLRHFLGMAFGEPVTVINIPATSRYESQAKAGLTPRTIHEINQYGDGVIVGGGNLYENGELEVDHAALKTLDVPLFLFSLSFGYVYNRRLELVRRTDSMRDDTIRALHEKAQFSLARDRATVEHLADAGCEATLGGCPSMFVNEFPQHAVPVMSEDADALISVRTPELISIPVQLRRRVEGQIRAIADLLSERGYERIRLLCHDHRDIPFAASFGDLDYVYTDDVYAYLSLLKAARVNVSLRLHSALPCLSYGTPVVKVSYDERGSSAMEMAGFGDWNIDMVREPDVAGAVADRLDRLDDLQALRADADPVWQDLRSTQLAMMSAFADSVRAGQERNSGAEVV